MTIIDLGTQGAKRQRYKSSTNPYELFRRIVDRCDDRAEAEEAFFDAVRKNDDLIHAICSWWFANRWSSDVEKPAKPEKPLAVVRAERETRNAEIQAVAVKAVEKFKREVLLDMMIGDKALRDYTFREVGKLGGKFTALSKGGKPNEKIGKLSETEVRKLFR